MKTGAELISEERQRQLHKENWSLEHDDSHKRGELFAAGMAYYAYAFNPKYKIPAGWPWDVSWWKPSGHIIRNLEKSGALLQAEVDRLERAKQTREAKQIAKLVAMAGAKIDEINAEPSYESMG